MKFFISVIHDILQETEQKEALTISSSEANTSPVSKLMKQNTAQQNIYPFTLEVLGDTI